MSPVSETGVEEIAGVEEMTQTTEELLLYFTGILTGAGLVVLILIIEAMHRRGWLLP